MLDGGDHDAEALDPVVDDKLRSGEHGGPDFALNSTELFGRRAHFINAIVQLHDKLIAASDPSRLILGMRILNISLSVRGDGEREAHFLCLRDSMT